MAAAIPASVQDKTFTRTATLLEEQASFWSVLSLGRACGLKQHTVGHILAPLIALSGKASRYQHRGAKPARPLTRSYDVVSSPANPIYQAVGSRPSRTHKQAAGVRVWGLPAGAAAAHPMVAGKHSDPAASRRPSKSPLGYCGTLLSYENSATFKRPRRFPMPKKSVSALPGQPGSKITSSTSGSLSWPFHRL